MTRLAGGTRALLLIAVAAALVLSVTLLPGTRVAGAQEDEADAIITVVHASPDAPAVDVVVDGLTIAEGLEFGNFVDGVPVSGGEHDVQVIPAGEAASSALIDESFEVDSGQAYQLAVANLLAELELRTYQSNLDDLPDGEARVRLINLVAGSDELDLVQVGGDEWFDAVAFGDASDHRNVEAGSYELDLRPNDSETSLVSASALTIDAKTEVTLIALGNQAEGTAGEIALLPLAVLVDAPCGPHLGISDSGEDACVRIVHAAVDAPEVDVYVEDGLVAEALAAGAATEFIALPAGEGRSVKLVPAGGSIDDNLVESSVDFSGGVATDIVVGGSVDDLKVINDTIDLSPISADQARLRVVHVSPDAGGVSIVLNEGEPTFEGIGFESFTDAVILDADTYDVQVIQDDGDNVLFRSEELTLEAGMVYDLIAAGSVDNGTFTVQVVEAPAQARADTGTATVVAGTEVATTEEAETLDEATPET
jgi:hypothetical protein